MTLAKVKPSVPPANGSWPRRPRNAVVMVIFTNHVKFITMSGRAMVLCNFSSEMMSLVKSWETHLVVAEVNRPESKVEEDTDMFHFNFLNSKSKLSSCRVGGSCCCCYVRAKDLGEYL